MLEESGGRGKETDIHLASIQIQEDAEYLAHVIFFLNLPETLWRNRLWTIRYFSEVMQPPVGGADTDRQAHCHLRAPLGLSKRMACFRPEGAEAPRAQSVSGSRAWNLNSRCGKPGDLSFVPENGSASALAPGRTEITGVCESGT